MADHGSCRSCRRRFVPYERMIVEVGGVRESLCARCLTRLGGDALGPAVYGRAEEIPPAPPPPPAQARREPVLVAEDPLSFGIDLEV